MRHSYPECRFGAVLTISFHQELFYSHIHEIDEPYFNKAIFLNSYAYIRAIPMHIAYVLWSELRHVSIVLANV